MLLLFFSFQLLVSYLMSRDDVELNVAAARLLLNLIPGLDSSILSVSIWPNEFWHHSEAVLKYFLIEPMRLSYRTAFTNVKFCGNFLVI